MVLMGRRNNTEITLLSLSLSLSISVFFSWRPRSPQSDLPQSTKSTQFSRCLTFGIRALIHNFPTMTETRSNSQNSEKIAALYKVTDSHEQTLQGIQK